MSFGIFIDSSLLINHLRSRNKENTWLADVLRRYSELFISATVEYEVEVGMTNPHRELWTSIRERLQIVPFESSIVPFACQIKHELKSKGKHIDFADLIIAASAVASDLPLATLNRKHFEPIVGLKLLLPTPDSRNTGTVLYDNQSTG